MMQRKRNVATLVSGLTVALLVGCTGLFNFTGDESTGGTTGAGGTTGSGSTSTGGTSGEVLPTSITLDVSGLPDDDTASAKPAAAASTDPLYVGADRTIRAATTLVKSFQALTNRALTIAGAIKDDITSSTQQQVQGQFTVAGRGIAYKADFAPFDIDGDGLSEGSGSPFTAPVALRLWVDSGAGYERFMCGLVTTRPSQTTGSGGIGQLFIHPAAAISDAASDAQFHVKWDLSDATHKWTEAYTAGMIRANYSMSIGNQRVDQRKYSDNSFQTTVRSSSRLIASPTGFSTMQFAASFKRATPFALVSVQTTGGTLPVTLSQVCVDLLNQAIDALGSCASFDAQHHELLPLPFVGDTDFPSNFPATPTF
jgi:hypothetical protein